MVLHWIIARLITLILMGLATAAILKKPRAAWVIKHPSLESHEPGSSINVDVILDVIARQVAEPPTGLALRSLIGFLTAAFLSKEFPTRTV